jgi:hypothetical protein
MSYPLIREQTAAILGAVDGMGIVHQYQRMAATWEEFLKCFKHSDGKINGCVITRTSRVSRQITLGQKEVAHVMVLRFYMGLNDTEETETAFQALIDAAVDMFDDYETLNDTCLTTHPDWGPMSGAVGLQADIVDNRVFGNVLCHFAECRLCALELKGD